ncbi:hypothetical protein U1Q18_036586 [Sarracenia purpurea var. burkii]
MSAIRCFFCEIKALLFSLALIVRAANRPPKYDSDDEYIGGPRQQARQPLINRPPVPATGVPVVAGTLDQHSGRNDAWNARMREKMKTLNLAAEEICGAQRMMKTLNFPVLEVAATLEAPNTCSFPIARCAMGCCVMGDAMERSCAGAVVRSSSTET